MSAYEIFLLAGAFFAALSVISLASMLLDQGSSKIFFILLAITIGASYFALINSPNGIDINDIEPAINKLISEYVK